MYFPWPGFFELVACADVYVHLADAQFSKGSFTNRVQIKKPGGFTWMTVPLAGKGSFQVIEALQPADPSYYDRHRKLLLQLLRGAPYLDMALDLFDAATARATLVEVLMASIEEGTRRLDLQRPDRWIKASDLRLPGRSTSRVIDIVKRFGGTRYVTAHGAAGYLDHEGLEAAGIEVDYMDYSLTSYAQLHGTFTPYVSVLDLIANTGADAGGHVRPRTKPWRQFLAERAARATT
jgi:hypothetical protein